MATEFYSNTECANLVLKKTTYEYLHKKLGHPHKQAVMDTENHYGINLHINKDEPVCVECALSKIRVQNFGGDNENQATTKGERTTVDISSINKVSYGGAKFWLLIQDTFTNYICSFFLSAKSELSHTFIQWIKTFQKENDVK
jgi:hypothetical protein